MELTDMFKECLYALNNLAEPNRAEIAMCMFTAISIFFTIKILNKQISISKKQTEIMEQQNKITLFDKRYEVYLNIERYRLLGDAVKIVYVDQLKKNQSLTGNLMMEAILAQTSTLIYRAQDGISAGDSPEPYKELGPFDLIRLYPNLEERIEFLFDRKVSEAYSTMTTKYIIFILSPDEINCDTLSAIIKEFDAFYKNTDIQNTIKEKLQLKE